jgi:integrase
MASDIINVGLVWDGKLSHWLAWVIVSAKGVYLMKKLTAREAATTTVLGRHSFGRNLYLAVTATASGGLSRRWIFRYVSPVTGARRDAGLGSILDVGLKDAREAAAAYRLLLNKGQDPLEEGKTAKAALASSKTLHQCMSEYVESARGGWKARRRSYSWADQWYRNFKLLGKLNEVPVGAIDTAAIFEAIKPIWASRTPTARVTLAMIERVLDAAKTLGFRSGDNPARWRGHFDKLPLPKRPEVNHEAAMPYADIPRFVADKLRDESFQCLDPTDRYRKNQVSQVRRHSSIAAQAVEFLILTATRQQETLAATWNEIDLDGALWIIPAIRTKSNREHRVPLSRQAVALLRKMAELRTSAKYIFHGQGGNALGPITPNAPLQVLRNFGIGPDEATIHGFRSSFKDWSLNESDFPDWLSEEALGHAVGDRTRRAYRRDDALLKLRALMQAWADYVSPAR